MYTRDEVIRQFKRIIKKEQNLLIRSYYLTIIDFLLLEVKYQEAVKLANKPLFHYFQYNIPKFGNDYFLFLYNTHNPVRFAVETFDSIEEIRQELETKRS